MRLKTSHIQVLYRLVLNLALVGVILMMSPTPAKAQDIDLSDYFQFTYEPVTFDKGVISEGETFHATISGGISCTKDLPVPLPVSEVIIVSQVVAEHIQSASTVTLNPSYTINVNPFPSKAGESTEISKSVPLQFPAKAKSGNYNVIGKINEARVKLILGSLEISSYLPSEQPLGTVEYKPTASIPTVENSQAPVPEQGTPPAKSYPSGGGMLTPRERTELEKTVSPELSTTGVTIAPTLFFVILAAGVSIVVTLIILIMRTKRPM